MDEAFSQLLWMLPLAVLLLMALAWLHQHRTASCNLVDALWALGVGAVSIALLVTGPGDPWRRLAVALLIGAWSLRLGGFLLATRVLDGSGEDGRYAALRTAKGRSWPLWSLGFYGLQVLAVLIFSLPALAFAVDPRPLGWRDALGGTLWLGAATLTMVADRQLVRWRAEHPGRTCRSGLWSLSRHPNYLGEFLTWAALGFAAWGGPWCWLAWIQVLIAFLLLRFVTGVPYAEAQALRRRGDDYRRYQQEVPPFFPTGRRRARSNQHSAPGGTIP